MTDAPAQNPTPAAATVADVMQPPLTSVELNDHVAAAAYEMKRANATALIVTQAQTGQPVGIITDADVTRAVADGKNPNDVRIFELMTANPTVVAATTSIREAAEIMTNRRFRHLPVMGDTGLVGIVDITDVCRALLKASLCGVIDGQQYLAADRPVARGERRPHGQAVTRCHLGEDRRARGQQAERGRGQSTAQPASPRRGFDLIGHLPARGQSSPENEAARALAGLPGTYLIAVTMRAAYSRVAVAGDLAQIKAGVPAVGPDGGPPGCLCAAEPR